MWFVSSFVLFAPPWPLRPHRIWLLPVCPLTEPTPVHPAAFSWNTSGSNLPQGPCPSFPSAQDLQIFPWQPLVMQVSAQVIALRGSFRYRPPPQHPQVTPCHTQHFSLLKISLLCTRLLPVFPVSRYTSQKVRPQLFYSLWYSQNLGKFWVPNRHLNKDLLKMEWISCADIPGVHYKLLSVMFILVWLEFHSDFIPWNRFAKRKDQKSIMCIPPLCLRGEWGGKCYITNGTLPKEGTGYSTGRLGPV